MIIKLFESAKDFTGSKIKNPFFGTYLFVWILRNWDFIYSLIYFDSSTNLESRLTYMKSYLTENSFLYGLLINLGVTFLILSLSYVLLNLSRFIVNYSELKIKPWIDSKIDSNNIVTKERYSRLELDRNELLSSLESIRDSLSANERELKEKNDTIKKLKSTIVDKQLDINEVEKKLENTQGIVDNNQRLYNYNNEKIDKLKTIVYFSFSSYLKLSDSSTIRSFATLYDKSSDDDKIIAHTTFLKQLEDLRLLEVDSNNGEFLFSELAHLLRKSITEIPSDVLKKPTIDIQEGLRKYLGEGTIKKI
ncbi:hypothetical protein [uncultured Dokdonia sp.]|uniref:hypothetical protein n=1 Tax=uncultured Dokdonia sp. TaxID=575653 RepID=UPI002623105B|nr:hypothetical protein [uncultured Dokdonia sp.]